MVPKGWAYPSRQSEDRNYKQKFSCNPKICVENIRLAREEPMTYISS